MSFDIPLLNLANFKRKIYLFTRNKNGEQEIIEENSFFPFFFEPANSPSQFMSYDGVPLRKVFVSEPKEVSKLRSINSYSSDIKFCVNFMINKINSITPSKIKYFFIDIEVLANDIPETTQAKFPVSSISLYNSFSNEIRTWFLGDYDKEKNMLDDFIDYIKLEKPDLWCSWNVGFDYPYLVNRIKDFAKRISPINQCRLGEEKGIFYPSGISIVDYLRYYKKVFMREASYALDYIAQKRLGEKSWKKTDFSKLSDDIRAKNINDIKRMCKIEEKFKIIPYFDEIRRLSKTQWEDLYWNSRIIEMLILEEAKNKNLVLPNKKRNENEEESFQGATRDSLEGLYENVSEFDLSSAYPEMIVNFCLDSKNIKINQNNCININGIYFEQNQESLLPIIVKKILKIKDNLKKLYKENPHDKILSIKYDAIKGVVNSAFGVMGNSFFRLFDPQVASTITFLVRDLLIYIKEKIELDGLKVIYWDTDAIFINTKEDISFKLNQYIEQWAFKKYNKENISLKFQYKGYYDKIFLLGRCHYYGILHGKNEPVIRGIEAKRSSSSKYEAFFQEELLNKIIKGISKENIENWVKIEQERIKTLPLEEISFPCKLRSKAYDKNYPIFQRAYDNTLKIKKDFKVNKGELFYYVFVDNDEVLAFSQEDNKFIDRKKVNWGQIIERNIFYKAEKIFNSLGWNLQKNINQLTLE